MPRRTQPASLEARLDDISALRREQDPTKVVEALRRSLGDRHNLIVARAAKVTAALGLDELSPDLEQAFKRLMVNPAKLDPGAQAAESLVGGLIALEARTPTVFSRGIRHVQKEPAWGGPVDVAIETRAQSAIGLVNSDAPEPVIELVPLLVDEAAIVRVAAARAIGGSGRLDAEAVLRLKLLVGDEEPEVLLECLAGLLRLAPERSLDLAESFLHREDPAHRQAAILALGESRLRAAVPLLKAYEKRELDRDVRRSLFLALATSRHDEALDYLVELVADSHLGDAYPAIDALAPLLRGGELEGALREAIDRSENRRDLLRHLDSRKT